MVQTSLNIFDIGVITVIGLSALLSFFRGFSREILSLGAWIGAAIITLYTFPRVSAWLEPQVKSAMVASGLASIGVFLISLVVISILTGLFLKFLKPSSEIGLLDNMIGLVFGTARGVLLVAIAYFIMTLVVAEKDYPDWIKGSVTRPYVARAADWVEKMVPNYLATDKENANKETVKVPHAPTRADAEKLKDDASDSFENLQRRIREENEAK